MNSKRSFFNFTEDKVFYDERKKRFIYLENSTEYHKKLFNASFFTTQRPDLQNAEQLRFSDDLKKGQKYLKSMLFYNKNEIRRLSRLLGSQGYFYCHPIMEDYLKQKRIDGLRLTRVWTWKDSTKIVEYFREHVRRTQKYGLDNLQHTKVEPTKEAMKLREDELVDYFLSEMRKKPVQ